MPENEAFASVLRKSLQQEVLDPTTEVVRELRVLIGNALMHNIYRAEEFSVISAFAEPAIENRPSRYPRTVADGRYQSAKCEIVRRITIRGTYRPGMSNAMFEARLRKGLPIHFRSCDFIAVCEIYFHSSRFRWELGFMELSYSQNGWYESSTKRLSCRPFIRHDKDGKSIYDTRFSLQNP